MTRSEMQHCESECPICGRHAEEGGDPTIVAIHNSRRQRRTLKKVMRRARPAEVETQAYFRCEADDVEWTGAVTLTYEP